MPNWLLTADYWLLVFLLLIILVLYCFLCLALIFAVNEGIGVAFQAFHLGPDSTLVRQPPVKP
jgi:hypothetical protein